MKTLLSIILLALTSAAAHASGEQAYFTGNQKEATSITGAIGYSCEYDYNGQKFWLFFVGSCPPIVVNRD